MHKLHLHAVHLVVSVEGSGLAGTLVLDETTLTGESRPVAGAANPRDAPQWSLDTRKVHVQHAVVPLVGAERDLLLSFVDHRGAVRCGAQQSSSAACGVSCGVLHRHPFKHHIP